MRACKVCNGKGSTFWKGFTSLEGKVYPDDTRACACCDGSGSFFEVNEAEILSAIVATKGKNKGKLRASMSSCFNGSMQEKRAYYVWRLARFHGGKDMTMPMTADLLIRGDSYKDELDKIADSVAKQSFGTDLAAANRWGRAFGYA